MNPLTVRVWIILTMNPALLAVRRNEGTDEEGQWRFKSFRCYRAICLMSHARVYPPPTSEELLEPMSCLIPHPHQLMASRNRDHDYHLPPQIHTYPYEGGEKYLESRDILLPPPDLNHVVCLFFYWLNYYLHTPLIKDLIYSVSKVRFLVMPSQWAIEIDYSKKPCWLI